MAKEYIEERDGGYYVAGTRVSLDSIVKCFNEGLSPEAILGEFEALTLAQVFGAITFYLENQPAIDSYRMRQKLRFEALRRASAPLPQELRERLEAAREHLHSGRSELGEATVSGLTTIFVEVPFGPAFYVANRQSISRAHARLVSTAFPTGKCSELAMVQGRILGSRMTRIVCLAISETFAQIRTAAAAFLWCRKQPRLVGLLKTSC